MEVDAVIAWVDGDDPAHEAKRNRYRPEVFELVGKQFNAVSAVRFRHNDELRYCVRSIKAHAPWIRTIWLVTDDQFPTFFDREAAERDGLRVVDHHEIFRGHEEVLPTFNSQTIETVLWRIEGLAERFIYFNDDMVLTGQVTPDHFFREDQVVLRGAWKEMTHRDRKTLHSQAKVNAARIAGYNDKFFSTKHVLYPMLKGVLRDCFERNPELLVSNIRHRFRDTSQFWPIGLHDHLAINGDLVEFGPRKELVHFSRGLSP